MKKKKDVINGKEVTYPGDETSYLGGALGVKIQARLDNIGDDPQIELLGPGPKNKKKSIALAHAEIREIQQVLDKAKKNCLFSGRKPVNLKPFVLFPMEIIQASNLKPLDKVVWAILFHFAGEKKRAWPSQQRIADMVPIGKRRIQYSLDRLEKYGYIMRRLRKIGGQKFHNEYMVNLNMETSKIDPKPAKEKF